MADVLPVTVVWAQAPRCVHEWSLTLSVGSVVADALRACPGLPPADGGAWAVSIWGKAVSLHAVLQAQDRVELCAPRMVDPKQARKRRFAEQGARAAGLFAQRR